MYIAFKWLVGLSAVMWLAICFSDIYIKRSKRNFNAVMADIKPFESSTFKNGTLPSKRDFVNIKEKIQYDGRAVLHGAMFFAGALAVTILNRKSKIVSYMKIKLSKLNIRAITKITSKESYEAVRRKSIAMVKYLTHFWVITINQMKNIKILFLAPKNITTYKTVHYSLLKKLKDIDEERRHLGQLLIAAIHDNKNIRMQYQLETMAKSRLVQHMEDTQRQIKENRSKYISFQQLYLITHQENVYLKTRVEKLFKEKNEAENNLMVLMSEVYKSKSKELKAFCSRFIVKTKNNLLNSDVRAEIHKFLQKSVETKTYAPNLQILHQKFVPHGTSSLPTSTRLCDIDIPEEDSIVPLVSDAPKLKGLPGEYVWTVKDKNGIIEKLYEYDYYDSDYDNGDTIRRIRQYSVYHDKDCLLDFSNSVTVFHGNKMKSHRNRLLENRRFLTDSYAFQQFLKCNENIITSSSLVSPTQRLHYG